MFVISGILHPLVPTVFVLTVGIGSQRLQAKRISSINPDSLLTAAKCNIVFFDKTGTLTKQGIDFETFDCEKNNRESLTSICRVGTSVCHTLRKMESGELVGTQVDKAAFEHTGASISHELGGQRAVFIDDEKYVVIKEFEFDNERSTQSVIVQDRVGSRIAFVKGSPEAIRSMCLRFTIPETFDATVQEAARAPFYQLAIAFKAISPEVNVAEMNRSDVETMMFFGGFLNFRNSLRHDTPAVLQELAEAGIPSVMITGDGVLTGITVARKAGMITSGKTVLLGRKESTDVVEWVDVDTEAVVGIDPKATERLFSQDVCLAVTGEAWSVMQRTDPDFALKVGKSIRVFGRCNPADKVSIVVSFVEQGYTTMMCGDGQNDCGSLKAADLGIALSSAEASIVAPFTSLDKSISSVTEVLREGRCVMASTLAGYSAYITYGQLLALITVFSAYFFIDFHDNAWLFIDCLASASTIFSLPLSKAANRLSVRKPTTSLLSAETVSSVAGTIVVDFVFIVCAYVCLWNQDWFACRKWSREFSGFGGLDTYESTVLFLMIAFQTSAIPIILNFGYTFRQKWFKNWLLVFLCVMWISCVFIMTLLPSRFSCFFRMNCTNEVSKLGKLAIP
jgi:magnesium-transporting ATPase (P-type)